jgi:hypothetical protein
LDVAIVRAAGQPAAYTLAASAGSIEIAWLRPGEKHWYSAGLFGKLDRLVRF